MNFFFSILWILRVLRVDFWCDRRNPILCFKQDLIHRCQNSYAYCLWLIYNASQGLSLQLGQDNQELQKQHAQSRRQLWHYQS